MYPKWKRLFVWSSKQCCLKKGKGYIRLLLDSRGETLLLRTLQFEGAREKRKTLKREWNKNNAKRTNETRKNQVERHFRRERRCNYWREKKDWIAVLVKVYLNHVRTETRNEFKSFIQVSLSIYMWLRYNLKLGILSPFAGFITHWEYWKRVHRT